MDRDTVPENILESKIQLCSNPDELVKMCRDGGRLLECVAGRLLELGSLQQFMDLWTKSIVTNQDVLVRVLPRIRENIRRIGDTSMADMLTRGLLDNAIALGDTFETYSVCTVISDIVAINKQFTSKALAILYFRTVVKLLKKAGSTISYLNAVHFLNELEEYAMSRREFEYLKEMAQWSNEAVAKELFCGIKCKGPEQISVVVDDSEYTEDPEIRTMLEAAKEARMVENTFENVALLHRCRFNFSVSTTGIKIEQPERVGFTSVVFKIAGEHQPQKIKEERAEGTSEVRRGVRKPVIERRVQETKKIEFKNRFSNLYKRTKLVKMHSKIEFEDPDYEERRRRRDEWRAQERKAKEAQQAQLQPYKEVVDRLREQLRAKLEEIAEKQRQEMIEKAKAEQERRKAEQEEKMWRKSSTDVGRTGSEEGIYVPNFSTMNLNKGQEKPLEGNKAGIYVPKFSTMNLNFNAGQETPLGVYATKSKKVQAVKENTGEDGKWRK